ncbi:MAG: hypothetical protein ACQEP8_05955 [Chlamydiota bacterium]
MPSAIQPNHDLPSMEVPAHKSSTDQSYLGWNPKDSISSATSVAPKKKPVDDLAHADFNPESLQLVNSDELFDLSIELYKLEFQINKENKTLYMAFHRTLSDEQLKHGLQSAKNMKSMFNTVAQVSSGVLLGVAGSTQIINPTWVQNKGQVLTSLIKLDHNNDPHKFVKGLNQTLQAGANTAKTVGDTKKTFTDADSNRDNTQKDVSSRKLQEMKTALEELMGNRNEAKQRMLEAERRRAEATQALWRG